MDSFSIGIESSNPEVIDAILRKTKAKEYWQGIKQSANQKNIANNASCIHIESISSIENQLSKKGIAGIITDVILNEKTVELADNIITAFLPGVGIKERNGIRSLIVSKINEGSFGKKEKWKSEINNRTLRFISSSDYINIDGFVTFRMKDFVKDVKKDIANTVNELRVEKEYNEFINLLKYFVEIQRPKIETIHIHCKSGGYKLMDGNGQLIDNRLMESLAKEVCEKGVNNDDLLVSTLITLAPGNIIIHNYGLFNNRELLQTINRVFGKRVKLMEK